MHHTKSVTHAIGRAVVALASGAVVLVATTTTAAAAPKPNNTVSQHLQFSDAQFTDCPSTPPAVETECLGVDVFSVTLDGHAVGHATQFSNVDVGVVVVHLHPDGTFDLDPIPIAVGSAPLDLNLNGQARVHGEVPLSDNTVAVLDFTTKGVGRAFPSRVSGPTDAPDCPSGAANLKIHQVFRDAETHGSITVHGNTLVPVSVVSPPFLIAENDTGKCLP